MKTLAITGAAGFVGRQILCHLLEADIRLRVIVRLGSARMLGVLPGNVEVIETSDLFAESPDRLLNVLHGVDTIVHAAWYAEPGSYLTSVLNCHCLNGTIRLAKAFADVGGRRFIGIGSCFEYGPNHSLLSTQTPLGPQTLYAATKVAAFCVLSQLLPACCVEFAWCRLFYLYGEGEDQRRLVPYLRRQLEAGEPAQLTSGNQVRDFLDVREAGARVAGVALGERCGPVNICSGVPITVRDLAERVADEYGRRDLLRFGTRPENIFDPPRVVGVDG
jgi:nucleoside-diphosphate-sugar epimerase